MNTAQDLIADQGHNDNLGNDETFIISTTIKKRYMDLIRSGIKTKEYKIASDFWNKRLLRLCQPDWKRPIIINFLCGQKVFKFNVLKVELKISKDPVFIDEKQTNEYYIIHLGGQI